MSTLTDSLDVAVTVGAEGRITVPARYRRFLELTDEVAPVVIEHDDQEMSTLLRVGDQGRATIPVDVREHLGVDVDDEVTLVFNV